MTRPRSRCCRPRGRSGDVDADRSERSRRHEYNFDAHVKLTSTLDASDDSDRLHTKGAPESMLPACTTVLDRDGREVALEPSRREKIAGRVSDYASQGQRVLAFARRSLPPAGETPARDGMSRLTTRAHGTRLGARESSVGFTAQSNGGVEPVARANHCEHQSC